MGVIIDSRSYNPILLFRASTMAPIIGSFCIIYHHQMDGREAFNKCPIHDIKLECRMTDEEKKALTDEAAAKKAEKEKPDVEFKKTETEEETEETEIEEETKKEDLNIDYAKELVAEKERRAKAEKALAERAFKDRKNKREEKEEEEEEEIEDDKPLTASQLKSILSRDRQQTQKILDEAKALEIAKAHTSSEAEAQAALEFWRNRVVPTGNLQEDILFAIGGLNHKRVVAQNEELRRSLRSKETRQDGAEGTRRDAPAQGEPKLASQDAQAIKRAGFVWDGAKRLYKKPLQGSKKTLYYDVKSKKRWVSN